MLAQNVLQTIGNTPHIRINRLFGSSHNVYVKSERSNPAPSRTASPSRWSRPPSRTAA